MLPDGAVFCVDPVSDFGYRVQSRNGYEQALTQLVKHVLASGDVFVDVGANEGYFCVIASRKGALVHAIEPQSRLIAVIQQNARLNNVAFRTHRLGLSDAAGTATLHLSSSINSGASSLFTQGAGEAVATTTLDALLSDEQVRKVRLLKIDCEGAEQLVVPGGARTLAHHRVDFLSIEYHASIIGAAACITVDHTIRDHGYGCIALASRLWVYHAPGKERELDALGPTTVVPPL
jgi:FkbM family methyltransferase